MATLRDIRTRIKGVQSTQKITKAMKMVAAAKLRRAQEGILNARPYAKKINSFLQDLITDDDRTEHLFFKPLEEVKNALIVVVTAERGLCGAFNTNVIKEASRLYQELEAKNQNPVLFCIGKKGHDFYKRRPFRIADSMVGVFNHLTHDSAFALTDKILASFTAGTYSVVYFVYNEFKSVVSQKTIAEQYLPVRFPETKEQHSHQSSDYIYEPERRAIFHAIVPKYFKSQTWRVLLESNAAEFGARMTAMENATNNAKELIRSLKLTYNKARQAAITKEILEIVGGANALKQ